MSVSSVTGAATPTGATSPSAPPSTINVGGKSFPLPTIYSAIPTSSHDFATSQGASGTNPNPVRSSAGMVTFQITTTDVYTTAYIDNKVLLASANDKMAFIKGSKLTIDKAIEASGNLISGELFRSYLGYITSIKSINSIGTGIIELDDPESVTQFETGMALQDIYDSGAGVMAARAAGGWVMAVDRRNGRITVSTTGALAESGTAGNPSSWAAGEYLVRSGCWKAAMYGLQDWIPATAPSASESYFNVDRSKDSRLYGVYFDGSKYGIAEALIRGSVIVGREGGKPDVVFMSFASYGALESELGAKVVYQDVKAEDVDIAFKGIVIHLNKSTAICLPDPNVVGKTAWMLEMSSWTLFAIGGEVPTILRYEDGNLMLRAYNADAAELRVGGYLQLGCTAPAHNAQIALSA